MRIVALDIFTYPVPFKVVFRHASARRKRAENIIVIARSDCGQVGHGEGCPRSYVTGETVQSCITFIRGQASAVMDTVNDVDDLRQWIAEHAPLIDCNPAAFCAIELALLDLMGKMANAPIEDLLAVPRLEGSYSYSAILGDAPYPAYRWQLHRYRREGFTDFKVKVTGKLARDSRKTKPFRRTTEQTVRIRIDANNLWRSAKDCIDHSQKLAVDFFAIEEPLQAGDLEGFARVGEACGCKIILDESLLRPEQLGEMEQTGRWIINLRISKMGGIIRSINVAQGAIDREIDLIIGAQVGETSILTRAALTVATAYRDNVVASEGAFGTHLLQRDLTTPCLMFGPGGLLEPDKIEGFALPGLGLAVDVGALKPVG